MLCGPVLAAISGRVGGRAVARAAPGSEAAGAAGAANLLLESACRAGWPGQPAGIRAGLPGASNLPASG